VTNMLVENEALGNGLARKLADKPAVLIRGHGASVGVKQFSLGIRFRAVLRAAKGQQFLAPFGLVTITDVVSLWIQLTVS